jgi:hypothetical protein
MNDVLGKRPEITPVATCSSSSGVKRATTSTSTLNIGAELNSEEEVPRKLESCTRMSSAKKRKLSTASKTSDTLAVVMQGSADRHKERMERYDRFLDLLQQLVNTKKDGK